MKRENMPAAVQECMEKWVYACGHVWVCMQVCLHIRVHGLVYAKTEKDKQIVSLKQWESA